ncbi:MAG: hypothetical protein JW952_05160 [Candidatus Eisenbacteria bacterium]|nr:hypothetical protein [Candidatus Eisenbacteria bacterium]
MRRLLTVLLVGSLLCLLMAPSAADALPYASVGYKLYHYEDGSWVRYKQGDPLPPGGATPGTNLWKYNYWVSNLTAPTGIYQVYVYFNSDNVLRSAYSSATGPTGWTLLYFPPVAPNNNWKERFRTSNSAYYVMPGDTLPGYEVQFTWVDGSLLPTPQNYDVAWSGGSEPGNTTEMPPDMTPVEAATWGRMKGLFK